MTGAIRHILGKNQLKLTVFGLALLPFSAIGQSTDRTLVVAADSSGAFWVGRPEGLFRLDSSGTSQRVQFDMGDSMRADGPAVTALASAEDGKIWVGTLGSGLHLFDPKTRKDVRFRRQPGSLSSLPSDSVFCIFKGKKELWVATPVGLSKWLMPLDLFRTFRPAQPDVRRFSPLAIEMDEKNPNSIWLPTEGGAFLFDKKGETLRFFTLPNSRPEGLKLPVSMPVLPIAKEPATTGGGEPISGKNWASGSCSAQRFWAAACGAVAAGGSSNQKGGATEVVHHPGKGEPALCSQMNPQFIFNSLTSIKNHILSNERLLAADYLGGFALLLRNILDHSGSERIPLSDELDTLRLYVSLEQLRFKKKFDFELRVDPSLPQQDLLVQPLILQPFVESAIRHGLQKKEGKGSLLVEISKKGDLLVYKIEDNGPSRARREAIRAATASPAEELQITRDRLMLHQKDATVEWTDLTDEAAERTGTRVEVAMRMRTENPIVI